MSFSIHPVETRDIDVLVRKVEYPAHQYGPLRLLMFPGSNKDSKENEEEIQWMIEGLLDTLRVNTENLLKACGLDGSLVGFIGWVYEKRQIEGTCVKKKAPSERKGDHRVPNTLDVASWIHVSKRLREERQRVLQTCKGNKICRAYSVYMSYLAYTLRRYNLDGSQSQLSTSVGGVYAPEVGL